MTRQDEADAYATDAFIYIQTASRGILDPKGKRVFLSPDVGNEELGSVLLDAMASSRFVMAVPRPELPAPAEVEYDLDFFDHIKIDQRFTAWVEDVMRRYSYPSRNALFEHLKTCSIYRPPGKGVIRIDAFKRVRDENYEGVEDFTIPANSSPAELGATLRLALRRCRS